MALESLLVVAHGLRARRIDVASAPVDRRVRSTMPIAVATAVDYLYQQQCTEASDTTAIERQQP
jgi:hypothetical protein